MTTEEKAKKRFISKLPRRLQCSDRKHPSRIKPKDEAIKYPYIGVNDKVIHYLIFDYDRATKLGDDPADSMYKCRPLDQDVPIPTFLVFNPKSGGCHGYYELSYPIPSKKHSRKAAEMLSDLRVFAQKHWDTHLMIYNQRNMLTKNPCYDRWRTICTGAIYTLSELLKSFPSALKTSIINDRKKRKSAMPARFRLKPFSEYITTTTFGYLSNIEATLFEYIRVLAYNTVVEYGSELELEESLYEAMDRVNHNEMLNYFDRRATESEIRKIAQSVALWTWRRRDNFTYRNIQTHKNIGVMKMKPIQYVIQEKNLTIEEIIQEVRRRQSKGAKRTHKQRRKSTEKKIKDTVTRLKKAGKGRPSYKDIAEKTGLSRDTVRRYKHLLQ